MTAIEIFGLGCLGGALPDLLRLIKARNTGAPAYVKQPFFWLMTVVLIVLGGFTAFYSGAAGAKEALAFGFGAPEILSRLAGGKPDSDRGPAATGTSGGASAWAKLRAWWSI